MGPVTGMIVFLLAVIICVVVGTKIKCNIGVLGMVFAFAIGTTVMGKSVAQVINYFPTSLMFMMMIVTFFYGYASQNGAIKGIADRLIYLSRNHISLLPLVLYATVYIVAALGAGPSSTSIMLSPIVFDLAAQVGMNPILAFLSLAIGGLAGGMAPWTSTGVMFKGIAETYLGEASANAVTWSYWIALLIIPTLFYLAVFMFYNRKNKIDDVEIKKPAPFNKEQKQTITMIFAIMLLVVIPVLVNIVAPNPVTKWISSHCDIKVLCAIGIVISCALKLGNSQEVIKNGIPWGTIIMICGMSMMISLAVETGMADFLGNWLGTSVPKWLIAPMVALLSGILSFVTTGPAVIFPLFIPMFPAIAASTGLSPVALTVALFAGTGSTGMSPFSQGGASAITGCKDEKTREYLWPKQLLFAFLLLGTYMVFSLLGVLDMIAGLFA